MNEIDEEKMRIACKSMLDFFYSTMNEQLDRKPNIEAMFHSSAKYFLSYVIAFSKNQETCEFLIEDIIKDALAAAKEMKDTFNERN